VLLASALAMRWASSNAWMPLNTEPPGLVVVSAVLSVIGVSDYGIWWVNVAILSDHITTKDNCTSGQNAGVATVA
jgi:hypothetical protein